MMNHMTKCRERTLIDSLSRIYQVDLIPKHDFNYFALKILASSCKASWIYNRLIELLKHEEVWKINGRTWNCTFLIKLYRVIKNGNTE